MRKVNANHSAGISIRDVTAACRRYPSSHGAVAITFLSMAPHMIKRPSQAHYSRRRRFRRIWPPQLPHPTRNPCGEIRPGKKRKGGTLAVLRRESPEATGTSGDHRASPHTTDEIGASSPFIRWYDPHRNAVPCSGGIRLTVRIGLNEL